MLYDAEIMVFKLYCTIVKHYIDYISIHLTHSKYIRNIKELEKITFPIVQ